MDLCIGGFGAVSKQRSDDRRQKSSQLVGTAYRTRDLAASYLSDAAIS